MPLRAVNGRTVSETGCRWAITGTEGEIEISSLEALGSITLLLRRRMLLGIGDQEVEDVDFKEEEEEHVESESPSAESVRRGLMRLLQRGKWKDIQISRRRWRCIEFWMGLRSAFCNLLGFQDAELYSSDRIHCQVNNISFQSEIYTPFALRPCTRHVACLRPRTLELQAHLTFLPSRPCSGCNCIYCLLKT